MTSRYRYLTLLLIILGSLTLQAQTVANPLRDRELLALVAGNALSENVVHAIKANGLAFRPTDNYRRQLTDAGADKMVLDALVGAKVAGAADDSSLAHTAFLEHLAQAGKLMREKQQRKAASELAAAAKDDPMAAELGFVMGALLGRENQWETAANVYQQVIEIAPDFPEVHTELAYAYYRLERPEDATREAKAALLRNSDDPEAHKTLGVALFSRQSFDAAVAEYREALRLKPNYASVHQNLAILYDTNHDTQNAIAEYKKYFETEEGDAGTHYELGLLLSQQGDLEGGIKQYREAKRLDPTFVPARQNLGRNLLQFDKQAALREFRELVEMSPEFGFGHQGLAIALLETDQPKEAEAEFRKACEIDPSDAGAVAGLGKALERQMKYDEAMKAYSQAVELDPEFYQGHVGRGRIYLLQKNYAHATEELRTAVNLDTSVWESHDLLGKALLESGDADGGITEYKASLLAWPGNMGAYPQLARAYEKKGDVGQALHYYKKAADEIPDPKMKADYAAAQKRLTPNGAPAPAEPVAKADAFDQQIAAAAEGKSQEDAWKTVFQLGTDALQKHHFDEAEKAYKASLAIIEKFAPHDQRTWMNVSRLAMVYGMQQKYDECESLMERGLKLAQDLFGPKSREVATSLEGIAQTASLRKNQVDAREFWLRALDIRQGLMGPKDPLVAVDLSLIATSFVADQQYDKAEPLALKALAQVQDASGQWDPIIENYTTRLMALYVGWGKFDQAETYSRIILSARERQFGSDNPMLAASLQSLEDILTKEGKSEEAIAVRKRREAMQADEPQGAK